MADEEQVVAAQTVSLRENQEMHVTISQHEAERFWRVEVVNPRTARAHMTTTLSDDDSFMTNLVRDAVNGEQLAWRHLAKWGMGSRRP